MPLPKLEVAVVEKTSSKFVLIPPAKVEDALPLTFKTLPIVVEPVMVVLPETVNDWFTLAPWKDEVAAVSVAVKNGAVTCPVNTPLPVTESGVPGEDVPIPRFPPKKPLLAMERLLLPVMKAAESPAMVEVPVTLRLPPATRLVEKFPNVPDTP